MSSLEGLVIVYVQEFLLLCVCVCAPLCGLLCVHCAYIPYYVVPGEAKKIQKMGGNSQLGLPPPPPRIIQKFGMFSFIFSQRGSLIQYVVLCVCLPVCLFQLAS